MTGTSTVTSECPVCTGIAPPTRIEVETVRRYVVHVCRDCGLAFTLPRPSSEDLDQFYGEAYFNAADTESTFGYTDYSGEGGQSIAAINAEKTWDDLDTWGPMAKASSLKRLLDVGAAEGDFALRATRDGWDAVACEIGESARAICAAKGLQTVATIADTEGPFGLITMFHVLEHLVDPLDGLTSLRRSVSPDGHLAIEVPQWRSAGRIVRRGRWSQLKPPEHINFFTRSSLARALELSGWRLVRASTPYPPARALTKEAWDRRDVVGVGRNVASLLAANAGFGGYLRAVAEPAE